MELFDQGNAGREGLGNPVQEGGTGRWQGPILQGRGFPLLAQPREVRWAHWDGTKGCHVLHHLLIFLFPDVIGTERFLLICLPAPQQ